MTLRPDLRRVGSGPVGPEVAGDQRSRRVSVDRRGPGAAWRAHRDDVLRVTRKARAGQQQGLPHTGAGQGAGSRAASRRWSRMFRQRAGRRRSHACHCKRRRQDEYGRARESDFLRQGVTSGVDSDALSGGFGHTPDQDDQNPRFGRRYCDRFGLWRGLRGPLQLVDLDQTVTDEQEAICRDPPPVVQTDAL